MNCNVLEINRIVLEINRNVLEISRIVLEMNCIVLIMNRNVLEINRNVLEINSNVLETNRNCNSCILGYQSHCFGRSIDIAYEEISKQPLILEPLLDIAILGLNSQSAHASYKLIADGLEGQIFRSSRHSCVFNIQVVRFRL